MHRLMAGGMDEAGYVGLLRAQGELYREWESERAEWLAGLDSMGWAYRSRANLIAADIVGARPAREGRRESIARKARSYGDGGACWGELYVIEGSALGGRVIVRRLRELYPHRTHHFYAMGEDAPSAWRRFQHLLDTHVTDDAARRSAVEGALHMFARFQLALRESSDHV
jgi:heme oxygenase